MRFVIDKKKIGPAAKLVASVVDEKSSLPAFTSIYLECGDMPMGESGNSLRLLIKGCDGENEVSQFLDLDGDATQFEPGAVMVNGKKFAGIVKAAADELVFEVKDKTAKIKTGKSRFSLGAFDGDSYPNRDIQSNVVAEIHLFEGELKGLLQSVAFAAAQNDVRYYLNGVCFLSRKGTNTLNLVATDGHRLAWNQIDMLESSPCEFILPNKAVNLLMSILSDSVENEVTIFVGERQVEFTLSDGTILDSKLVDGKFPDFETVIPLESSIKYQVTFKKDDLNTAIKNCALISDKKKASSAIEINQDGMGTIGASNNIEDASVELESQVVQWKPDENHFRFGVNYTYLADNLAVIVSSHVMMAVVDDRAGVQLTPVNENSQTVSSARYVIMPMRL